MRPGRDLSSPESLRRRRSDDLVRESRARACEGGKTKKRAGGWDCQRFMNSQTLDSRRGFDQMV